MHSTDKMISLFNGLDITDIGSYSTVEKISLYSGFRKDSIKDLNTAALSAIRANVANYNIEGLLIFLPKFHILNL